MRSAWCASSKKTYKPKNNSVHTCPVLTWSGWEVFIYSHPYPRYSWETGWEICSNQLEETSPIDRQNVSHQVHKTTNEQSPRKKRERNSGWFQCKWIPPEVRITHACPDLSGLVQTIFSMHLECFFRPQFFFSVDGTSQGCCSSNQYLVKVLMVIGVSTLNCVLIILEHFCLQPSGGDIPVPVRSPKSSTVERG